MRDIQYPPNHLERAIDRRVRVWSGCFWRTSSPGSRALPSRPLRARIGCGLSQAPARKLLSVSDRPWAVCCEWQLPGGV